MAYFANDFFASEHFKAPFYGEEFFQGDYFADMTIAHGISGGTTDATTVTIVCGKYPEGTYVPATFEVVVDGAANVVTNAVATAHSLALTVTDTILTGEVIRVSYPGESTNNVGILKNEPVANNEV